MLAHYYVKAEMAFAEFMKSKEMEKEVFVNLLIAHHNLLMEIVDFHDFEGFDELKEERREQIRNGE